MKNTNTNLVFLILLLSTMQIHQVFAQEVLADNWEKVSIIPNVSISFPLKPVYTEVGKGQQSFVLKQADSTAIFRVLTTDLQTLLGMSEAVLKTEVGKEQTWKQIQNDFMASMGKDGKLINSEMIEIQNTKALKLKIERKNIKGEINIYSVIIFIKGTNKVDVIFNSRAGKADEALLKNFHSSISIQ